MTTPAVLALEDGTVFRGVAIGADGTATGEVVFNTAMTGYQEILTDPSYSRQIVTLTYPHIGNTGTNPEDLESNGIHAAGLVIRDLPLLHSNWRATESLPEFLKRGGVVAIADIDTRQLTRILREKGAQAGCIMAGGDADPGTAVWSPVTGVVVQVRPYRLYDRHDDFEIHIRPDGWSDVDVVLIHVEDVAVEAGGRVFAGATRIASVRKMSDKMEMQLAGYTSNGGDHVHLQLNLIEDPASLPNLGES